MYKNVNIYHKNYFLGVIFLIGKICGVICVISFVFACFTGNVGQLGGAVYEGAEKAVQLTISLVGMMCLWNGIMQVMQASGIVGKLARAFSPVLRVLFPDAYKKKNGIGEIAASFSANMLGIGNAATPLAVKAMVKLQENNLDKDSASDDMIMFTVLGCASLDIFPTTLIALRRAAGSANPFEIIVPVWVCSAITALLGVVCVKLYCLFWRK